MRGRKWKVFLLIEAVSSYICIASMVSELNMSMKHGQNDSHTKTTVLTGYNRQTETALLKLRNW